MGEKQQSSQWNRLPFSLEPKQILH